MYYILGTYILFLKALVMAWSRREANVDVVQMHKYHIIVCILELIVSKIRISYDHCICGSYGCVQRIQIFEIAHF